VAQIKRLVEIPSKECFEKEYLLKGIPVVIEKCVSQWPAASWTLNSIKEKAGHRQVFVRRNTNKEEYKLGRRYNIESMKFHDYIENIQAKNAKSKESYLAVQNIKKALPELETDLGSLQYIDKLHGGPYLWVARAGHYEFCHFDPDDNFLVILSGQKRVRLYGADIHNMYPNILGSKGKTIQSQVDCDCPDLDTFPKFNLAKCQECILNSGDVLFFPAFWWHQVTTLEDTISMNTFFGNPGTNIYLSKVMSGPQWDCFQYWLLNIIEQNRHTDRFVRLLQYLPEVIETFLLKQWKEVPSPEQLQTLVDVVHTYCGIDTNVKCTSLEKNKNPPPLKIRGLLWRS